MGSEWREHSLGELCSLITDGKHGDCRNEAGSGYYFLSVKDVFGDRMVYDDARQIMEADFAETHRRTNLEPGDVLFTNTGTIGRMAIAPDDPKTSRTTFQKSVAILKPKREIVLSRFLYFALRFNNVRLSDYAAGTTQKNLLLKDLRAFTVQIPPLAEQKAIASILGVLDDKIELNRRMNATLEGMARALFQSWFVDFDPVRVKLNGRKPEGLDKATAALFPDAFEESPIGAVPKGWEVKTLSDLTSLITKGTTPTQDDMGGAPDPDAQINYVRVNSIDEDGSVLADKLTTIPESVHAGVLKRSILMANDVLYTIAGTIGRIALAEDWLLPANTNQAVAIIRPELEIPSGFLMLSMRHEVFRAELHNNIVHAVQANLSLGMISKARVVVPLQSILQQLFRPIDVLLSQISANRIQSRTLANLRDTLLPKLLSGELSVASSKVKA